MSSFLRAIRESPLLCIGLWVGAVKDGILLQLFVIAAGVVTVECCCGIHYKAILVMVIKVGRIGGNDHIIIDVVRTHWVSANHKFQRQPERYLEGVTPVICRKLR